MADESYLDLRVLRTRKSIRNAFLALLEEKELNKISVHSIAQKAEINRVTFYLHYKDINDLIDSLVNDLLTDVRNILTKNGKKANKPGSELTLLVVLLEHIAANAQLYKALLVSKHIPFFTPKLMELITGMILYTEEPSKQSANHYIYVHTPPDIARWYASSALIGTISMWLGEDMPYSPQFLAEQLMQLNPFRPE